ncbi:MAG: hypothetical protein AAF656_07575 [Planctomycetota bacterium]
MDRLSPPRCCVEQLESRQLLSADLTGSYDWNPVKIGAGGFVVGIATHPTDADARYVRTDVGNAYRWVASSQTWDPMLVRRPDGSGLPASLTDRPAITGVESIAIDPSNPDIVYISLPYDRTQLVGLGNNDTPGSVYKSTDRGLNFVKSNLAVEMSPNSKQYRSHGERMAVDPNNSNIVYYGTRDQGLQRSTDGGFNFANVTGTNGPAANENVLNVLIHDDGAQSIIYLLVLDSDNEQSYANGRVLRSTDGGSSWTNISASSTIGNKPQEMALGPDGTLWVTARFSNQVWRYQNGSWLQRWARTPNPVTDVAVDPTNTNRIFAASENGGISRSIDGGASWERIAAQVNFGNTLGWLPQPIQPEYKATASIAFDAGGELLMVQGNEGVLSWTPSPGNTANENNPPQWDIISNGIEELVTHDVKLLPGSGDRAVTAVHDATGHVVDDPDTFTAEWIPQQDQLIVNATGVAYAPDNADYVVIASGDPNNIGSGDNYSSYSTDGGDTWNFFASRPAQYDGGYPAIGKTNGGPFSSTPIVILPLGDYPPIWSDNGGVSWQVGQGFDLITQAESDADPVQFPAWKVGRLDNNQIGFQELSLRQHALVADPFVADRFYLKLTNGGFWRSNDGGQNWTQLADDSKLPMGTYHGQLRANPKVQNELWFSTGNEGSFAQNGDPTRAAGLWRSQDGGVNWQQMPGIEYSFALDLGTGSGQPGDADHAVYVYGKRVGDDTWGTFRSDDRGLTWDRISRYPTGLIDVVTSVGASWDTHGLVYLGFVGNSFVYGQPTGTGGGNPPPTDVVALEAEAGTLGSLWDVKSDTAATGGAFLEIQPGNNAIGAAPTTTAGRASYQFSLATTGAYRIFGRTIAPNGGDDSFWVRVDGGSWVRWNSIAGSTTWQWDAVHDSDNASQPVTWNLAAGTHTLDIAYREDGTRLDKLVIQPTSLPTPTGTGPAATLPPKLKVEAEDATGDALWVQKTEGSIVYREVADGTSGSSNFSNPDNAPKLSFALVTPAAGNYTLNLRGRGNDWGANSVYVRVNGSAWQQIDFGGSNVWETVSAGTFALGAGANTVEIAQREDGTDLDWIELVPA